MFKYKYDRHNDEQIRYATCASRRCATPGCGGNIWTRRLVEIWNEDETDYIDAHVWECNNCRTHTPINKRSA